MKRITRPATGVKLLCVLALALSALACNLPFVNLPAQPTLTPTAPAGIATPRSSPLAQPTPTATPPNTSPPSQGATQPGSQPDNTTALKIINNSGGVICIVNLTTAGDPSWGDDWLGAGTIPINGVYNFTVSAGRWDLRALTCDGTTVEEAYDFAIPASGLTWIIDAPVTDTGGSLTIINNSTQTIWYAYLAPAGAAYTDDTLGTSTISSQGSYTITNLVPGVYCLKVESGDHTLIKEICDIAVAAGSSVTIDSAPIFAINGDVTIVNNLGTDVFYIYISPNTSSNWGSDWLGANTLPAGSSVNFEVGTPGYFDIKLEDASHNALFTSFNTWIGPGTVITAS